MFRTKYNLDNSKFISKSGTGLIPVYVVSLDENGNRVVEQKKDLKGKVIFDNIYEKIQANADSTNINNIIEKFVKTGDSSYLEQEKGAFLDLTTMPTSQFEMQNKLIRAKESFAKLPQEIRANFDNDVNKYIAMAGHSNFFELLGYKDLNNDKKIDIQDVKLKGENSNEQPNTK